MKDNYSELYDIAQSAIKKVYQERKTYPKKTILPDEDELINTLKNLETCLNCSEEVKSAYRTVMLVKDTFDINYFADISEKCWNDLYFIMRKLKNPKSITNSDKKQFHKTLLFHSLLRWPQGTSKTDKRDDFNDKLGRLICKLIRDNAGINIS